MKGKFLRCHSPTILACAAGVGVIATVVMAVKATPKAVKILEDAKVEKGDDLTKLEIVQATGPVYIPAAVVGLCTIVCIFGTNALNKRQQASLASAYALLDQSYKRYRNKGKELFGEESDSKIRNAVVQDEYQEKNPNISDGKQLFYEEYYGDFFERTKEEILLAEYHFNRNFILRGYATLNEFYEFLGLDPIKGGDTIGWSTGAGEEFYGYQWVDFNHEMFKLDDGLTAFTITMPFSPTADFMDY